MVSIHASAREATQRASKQHRAVLCFNPRLRTGGDYILVNKYIIYKSFNPRLRTGGDDSWQDDIKRGFDVSIHASAREATQEQLDRALEVLGFNPRLRTGGDSLGKRILICKEFRHAFREPTLFKIYASLNIRYFAL